MIKQFTFNHFEVNTYVIVDTATKQCAIVDPACEASFEDAQLTQYIEQEQLRVTHILLTHAHVDHIAGLRQVCEHYKTTWETSTYRSLPTAKCCISGKQRLNVATCLATVPEVCAL